MQSSLWDAIEQAICRLGEICKAQEEQSQIGRRKAIEMQEKRAAVNDFGKKALGSDFTPTRAGALYALISIGGAKISIRQNHPDGKVCKGFENFRADDLNVGKVTVGMFRKLATSDVLVVSEVESANVYVVSNLYVVSEKVVRLFDSMFGRAENKSVDYSI
jgi:hypothetical protein